MAKMEALNSCREAVGASWIAEVLLSALVVLGRLSPTGNASWSSAIKPRLSQISGNSVVFLSELASVSASRATSCVFFCQVLELRRNGIDALTAANLKQNQRKMARSTAPE